MTMEEIKGLLPVGYTISEREGHTLVANSDYDLAFVVKPSMTEDVVSKLINVLVEQTKKKNV